MIAADADVEVRVWFEDVAFDNLARWMHELETRHGVRVTNADLERRAGAGLVNARLTLVRGG